MPLTKIEAENFTVFEDLTIPFSRGLNVLVGENGKGLRKIALLWQLIKNGTLEKGLVLFWEEPEANINSKYILVLAELKVRLLQLRKIWGVEVAVLNEELAREYSLAC